MIRAEKPSAVQNQFSTVARKPSCMHPVYYRSTPVIYLFKVIL